MSAITKKGRQGILYLDKEPKLYEEIPTAKANIKEKIKQNCIVGSALTVFQIFAGPTTNNIFRVINKNISASIDERATMTFLASQIYGLNNVTLTASGNFESIPPMVGEKSPRV